MAPRNGRKVGVKNRHQQDRRRCRWPPPAGRSLIERSSPKRGASLVASIPAANTTMTVPAKNRPSWIGVKPEPLDQDAGAAENIANNPPMIRLTVAAGTRKRRSAIRPR